jgi:hypothetical protein
MLANPVLKGWYEALNSGSEERAAKAKSELVVMQSEGRLPKEVMDPKWMKSAWDKTIDAAEKYNDPGRFSTFIAFEWTVNADGGDNLHRSVIFRDGKDRTSQILPLTTFETQDSKKLWEWLAAYEEKTGGRVLAIPHNGNMSNGRMFEEKQFDGSPMTKEWAEQRAKYERLFEVTRIKGQSESHPTLSPNDEFASWDLWDRGNLILKPKPKGALQYDIGAPELTAVFTDPDFDPAQKAVYYVRVLEIPTPRWTLYDKIRFGDKMDEKVPLTLQERAFSSPIWYAP